jgi:hypothetical protein
MLKKKKNNANYESYEPQNISIHIIFHTQVAHTSIDTKTSQYEKNGG